MTYEINFLVLQSKTAELEKIRKDIKKFIESYGAKIVEEKEYLKRKLAYEIQHENYGFFTVLRFEFKNGTNLDELKVKLNQKSEVARYIIVRADELPSLEEQDAKKLEKIHSDRRSIKSEDVEKAVAEQKKAEVKKSEENSSAGEVKKETKEEKTAEEKPTPEKEVVKEEKKEEEKETKEESSSAKATEDKEEKVEETQNQTVQGAEEKKEKKEDKKPEAKTEKKEKVSLDELDKKLDEILNS